MFLFSQSDLYFKSKKNVKEHSIVIFTRLFLNYQIPIDMDMLKYNWSINLK